MGRVVATLFLLLVTIPAAAEQSGVVFSDDNANGERDPGEAPRQAIAVTNGRDVVVTGADGRYALPERDAGFVSVTCPADGRCPVWFRRGSGDFGIVPTPTLSDFFFVHMSDVHAYPKAEDQADLLPSDGRPWWLPRAVVGWFLLRELDQSYPHLTRDEIAGHLRDVVARYRPAADSWDTTVMMDYVDLATDPTSGLITPGTDIPRAFAEVAALRPPFVVNTGDLILEGNSGDPEPVESWYRYYTEVAGASGLEIYETIGNNELAGTDNQSFRPSDPRYGKLLYRRYLGPTHYSFDRGPFHFVAVDSHRREFEVGEPEDWSFYDMEPEVRDWLDADLGAAGGREIILLNHEPFHYDPIWDFEGDVLVVEDDGLLEKYGVGYTLTGHIHRNGFQDAPEGGGTTHITTGALSGFRWSLPTSFDSRGYRLVYARGARLYSAWKDLGRPLLGFIDPKGDPRHHPASTHAASPSELRGTVSVVAVACDADGPFEEVQVLLDGEPLVTTRWGDYFVHASFEAEVLGEGPSFLELKATGRDGALQQARLDVSRSAAP